MVLWSLRLRLESLLDAPLPGIERLLAVNVVKEGQLLLSSQRVSDTICLVPTILVSRHDYSANNRPTSRGIVGPQRHRPLDAVEKVGMRMWG